MPPGKALRAGALFSDLAEKLLALDIDLRRTFDGSEEVGDHVGLGSHEEHAILSL